MKADVIALFSSQFEQEPELIIRAPGRINLIGEHTDFNMGWVLPAAINKNIFLAFSKTQNNVFSMRASPRDEFVSCTSEKLLTSQPHWAKYLTGILELLLKEGYPVKGFNLAFSGDIHIGAGLSSSAALCCGFIYGLNSLLQLNLTKEEMAIYGQKAEHLYAGVKCGLMDQYAVLFGKEGNFLKLDCRSFAIEYVPAKMDGYTLMLCDSGVKHKLAESAYNKRREECEEGLNIVKKKFHEVNSLRDVSQHMLEELRSELPENVYKRCNYIVKENQRHKEVCENLQQGNVKKIGDLLYETHLGLRDSYEVSCPELDFLVDTAMKIPGVAGARMMGGGFGGCSINLVQKDKVENFTSEITKRYKEKFGINTLVFEVQISNGISKV